MPGPTATQGAVYILADVHLGIPTPEASLQRERKLIAWLESVAHDAQEVILLGDLFDFWFEWKDVVPKGHVRLLGTLARLRDGGLNITVFAGNHDLWYRDYFPKELGIPVQHGPVERTWFGTRYFLGHGDGLGPGDRGYKALKALLSNRLLQAGFAAIHPRWAVALARYSSKTSAHATRKNDDRDHGEQEFLVRFLREELKKPDPLPQFYIFGHRHRARMQNFDNRTTLLVLGDWISDYAYIRIDDQGPVMLRYDGPAAAQPPAVRPDQPSGQLPPEP